MLTELLPLQTDVNGAPPPPQTDVNGAPPPPQTEYYVRYTQELQQRIEDQRQLITSLEAQLASANQPPGQSGQDLGLTVGMGLASVSSSAVCVLQERPGASPEDEEPGPGRRGLRGPRGQSSASTAPTELLTSGKHNSRQVQRSRTRLRHLVACSRTRLRHLVACSRTRQRHLVL